MYAQTDIRINCPSLLALNGRLLLPQPGLLCDVESDTQRVVGTCMLNTENKQIQSWCVNFVVGIMANL